MGKCLEFATTITAGCDHPMDAHSDCCVCDVCGTRCTGHFGGCPAVWAAATAPRPVARAEDVALTAPAPAAAVALLDADLAIDWATGADAPAAQPDPRIQRHSHRRTSGEHGRRRLAAIAAAVAIIGAGLGTVLAGGSSNANEVNIAPRPAELQFKPITVSSAVSLERNWRLEGSAGHRFIGTLTFSNSTDAAAPVTFDETLPKSLASSVDVVLFDPLPIVVNADPVVEYQFVLAPNQTATATYEISVPPDGADAARLDAWAKDVKDELAQRVADAQAALAAAHTAAERAAAQAFLDAARSARSSSKPTPHAPGCTFCGTAPPPPPTTCDTATTCDTPLDTIPETTTTT